MKQAAAAILITLSSFAFAQPVAPPAQHWRPPSGTFITAGGWSVEVRKAASGLTQQQLVTAAGSNLSRQIAVRTAVSFAGGALIGATALNAALRWFYEEAQRSTGTPLDDWYSGMSSSEFLAFVEPDLDIAIRREQCPGDDGVYQWVSTKIGYSYTFEVRVFPSPGFPSAASSKRIFLTYSLSSTESQQCQHANLQGDTSASQFYSQVVDEAALFASNQCANGACWDFGYSPGAIEVGTPGTPARMVAYWLLNSSSLADHLRDHPDSAEALADLLPDYISDYYDDPATADDPRILPPGWEWQGEAPNINQRTGDPYADPNLDTDGDGWIDGAEADYGTRADDADMFPDIDEGTDTDGGGVPDWQEWRQGHDPTTSTDDDPDAEPMPDPDPNDGTDPDGETDPNDGTDPDGETDPNEGADPDGETDPNEGTDPDGETDPNEGADPDGGLRPAYPAWIPFRLTASSFDRTKTHLQQQVQPLADLFRRKLGIMFGAWVPSLSIRGTTETCRDPDLTMMGYTETVQICDSPITAQMKWVRGAMLAAVLISFYIGLSSLVSRS